MAEFALGLTKTTVEGTVSRVRSAIDEEAKLRVRVQNDLVFITGEFEMMQSFLNAANKERVNNQVVRTWVRQIRDLTFDVEDCLDFIVILDIKSGWSWLWRVLPGCMAPPRPLDQAVAEIQRLKARVEDVSHRNTRYNLIGDTGSSANSSKHALITTVSSPAPELVLPASADVGASSSAFHILREVWEAAGKMRPDMGDLKKLVTNEGSDREVISLWGSPGSAVDLGTTSIVRKAYNDPEICQKFKSRAWVKLMHPFDLDEFLKSLLTQLYATSSHNHANLEPCFRTTEEYHLIKAKLMQQLCEQNYLVIVEQLSTVVEWDAIKKYLPDSKNGSRIVVTTQQLGLALSCTGEQYQVSDLRQFSYGQSLCAIFNKVSGRHSDMGELIWQLRCGGVISVWQYQLGKTIVDKVYTGITHKSKDFDEVEFDRHSWVDVPNPFNLSVFSRHLFLNLLSNDLRATKIAVAGDIMDDSGVIDGCCKLLREDYCLIIINGVNSMDDWDLIKATFLSKPTKGCILVITTVLSVARYCVDEADRVLNIKDLNADVVLRHLVKGCEYDGIKGNEASSRGRFFSNRRQEACDWTNKFQLVVDPDNQYSWKLRNFLQDPGVISLCGIDGAWGSALARKIYYDQMLIGQHDRMPTACGKFLDLRFTKFSWVDVPHPFDLTDFSWRLILDFYSDDLKAKETTAVDMMEGRQKPIEGCLNFLRQDRCFIVINGIRSTEDWDLIRGVLLSKPTKGSILVITDKKSVATHCVDQIERVVFIDGQDTDVASHPLIEKDTDLMSNLFSSRKEEARDWITKFDLIGHHSEWESLCQHLLQSGPGVFSTWGIAGVGKSTLVRSIYYTNMIGLEQKHSGCLQQVTKYSWVDVPQPFNLTELSRRLLIDFHSDELEAKETVAVGMMEGQDPIEGCRKFLDHDKCFIVIDGLRSMHDWDLIKSTFLPKHIKGCILVITSNERVARHCVDKEDRVIYIKGLEADAAINLFTKQAAWGGNQLTSDEVELSRLTMTKCGGLSIVITAIGEYCRISYESKKHLLESINADFMGMMRTEPIFLSLRGLFSWMQSYFDNCPDLLKPCIFYLSVFPLGHDIRRRRLLRRWIAEGYSRDTSGSIAEENGEKFFVELVKLSIIQQQQQQAQSRSKAVMCQVNGFFREYIISHHMEDNLVFALEGCCSLNSTCVGQHLTISSSWDRDKIVYDSMDLSRLRSLTVFGEWRSFFISTDVDMGLLRVLDLENTSGVRDGDIEQIAKLLLRLKFLSLRGCKDITRLPRSLGGLRQLQTLDVKGTSIVMLPCAIIKLQKLQYIRAGTTIPSATEGLLTEEAATPAVEEALQTTTPWSSRARDLVVSCSWLSNKFRCRRRRSGVKVPAAAGIGKLTALHTLGVVNITSSGKAILKELKKLTQLHKLGVSGINRENWHDLCSVISGYAHLESFSLRLDDNEEKQQQEDMCCLDDISKPPHTLKSLKLHGGNVHVSVVWMKQLGDNLIKAHFQDLELIISTQEDIDSLIELPFRDMFRHVCLKPIEDGELHYERLEAAWPMEVFKASVLKIDCSSYRLAIVFGGWIPQYVEVVVVHCSTNEASLEVSGLEKLRCLKEVCLKGSYSDKLKQHLRQKVDEHEKKPVLKLDPQETQQSAAPNPCACLKRLLR